MNFLDAIEQEILNDDIELKDDTDDDGKKENTEEDQELTIQGIARLPKEYWGYPSGCSYVLSDIAEILIDLDSKDTYIIQLPYYEGSLEERKELIKKCVDIIETTCAGECAILIESFLSHKEFPRDKYTLTQSIEPEKELIPLEEILKRERDMLTDLGFIYINDYTCFAYKESFIYGNVNGKLVRTYIDKLTQTR